MASKISIPVGMDAALEGLTRAVLKEQPENIYVFAVEHFERLVRMRDMANLKTHNAGLSPSSTQDSNSKPPVSDEDAKPISEEKSVTEEPESNDTSYGVEATAVRTLAATTGTVAILGTTAKTNDKKSDDDDDNEAPNTSTPPIASDVIPEGNEKEEEDTIAVVHDTTSKTKDEVSRNEDEEVKKTVSPLDTRPTSAVKMEHILLEEVKDNTQSTINKTDDISVVDNKPFPVDDVVKREPSNNVPSTLETEKSKPEEGVSVTNEEDVKVERGTTLDKTEVESDKDVTSEISNIEPKLKENEDAKDEETEEDKVSELNKGNEEDNSKSISSERLKTNSISDTTLSESYNAELENNSVKQSPSAEKAVESFDSSSTIEFVDLENKENARQKRDVSDLTEGNQTQVVSLEPQALSDTLPNVLSEVEQNTTDRSETFTEIAEEQLAEVKPSDKEIPAAHTPVVANEIETVTPVSDDLSESVIKSDVVMDEPKKVESGPKVDEVASDIMLPKSEELKAGEQNTSEINVNETDIGDEPVDETTKAAATTIQATFRGFQSRKQLKEEREYDTQEKMKEEEVRSETEPNKANTIVTADEKLVTEYDDRTTKEEVQVDVDESQDNKLDSAATTIQATFRGFQMRKQLKEETKDESEIDLKDKQQIAESEINENVTDISNDIVDAIQNIEESRNDKVDKVIREGIEPAEDDKINSAATAIQATFRGYQTRKQLKEDTNDDTKTYENETISAQITEVQKEIQPDINQEEKPGEIDDEKANTAATTIQANFRGFQARKQLKEETENEPTIAAEENENVAESMKQEEIENISDAVDEKITSAATTIQATFRGFQTRKQLKEESEDNREGVDSLTETATAKMDSTVAVEEETKAKAVELEAAEKISEVDDIANSAATAIQATFRGFQTRKHIKEEEESQVKASEKKEEEEIQVIAAEKDNVSETVENKTGFTEEASKHKVSTEEQNEIETDQTVSSATTIQATFRGYQTRKQLKDVKEGETFNNAEIISEPTEDAKEENETKDITISEETKETITQAVDDIIDSAATTIQAAFRGYQVRQQQVQETVNKDLTAESDVPVDHAVTSNADNASHVTEDLAATKIQATFRGFQARQQLKNENDENLDNKLEQSPLEHSPSELSKASEDDSEQLKRQSEGDKDSLSEEIRQSLSKLEDTIQREENKLNMVNERLPEQIGESSDEGYEQPDASGDGSFDRGTRTPTALTPEQIDSVKEEVDEICKQAVATTESILAVKSGLGGVGEKDDAVSKEETEDKDTHVETPSDGKHDNKEDISVDSSEDATQKERKRPETLVVIEDADEKLVCAATTIQATFRGYQTRQRLAETEQSEQPDSLPDFPPPALDDDYLFGPSVADEDLPPPDFEALESSYSEDAPTEPLAPPPPLDQDTEKFIEEEEEEEDIDEEELKSLQRPPECDELPENRLTTDKSTSGETESTANTSTDAESSLSSAATKIQAGVRGYLTRKHVHGETTSTSGPSIVDSDQSLGNLSTSREEEGPVRSNISMEEESEICRHKISPDISVELKQTNLDQPRRPTDKRMSLGSNIIDQTKTKRKPLRPTLSVQTLCTFRGSAVSTSGNDIQSTHKHLPEEVDTADPRNVHSVFKIKVGASAVSDDDVWDVLKNEMSEAATVIQSNYRGYRARKQLQREDAVQVLTSSSSVATNGVSSLDRDMEASTRNSGELHDIIALTPPNIEQTSSIAAEGGTGDLTASTAPAQISTPPSDEMVKRRAEVGQHQHQSAAKKTHTSLTGTAGDQVLKDANIAAAKIQAGFRGYKVRKQLRNMDTSGSVNGPKRSGANNRLEARQPKSPTMSLEERSATKIQAGVRGFLVRRRQQAAKDAATKIQAGFRGFKARRQVKDMKTDK